MQAIITHKAKHKPYHVYNKQHYTSLCLCLCLCKLRLNKNGNWEEVDVIGAMEGRRGSRRRVSRREAQSHKAEEFLKLSQWCTCLARRKISPNATTMTITMMIPSSRLTLSSATAFNATTRSLFSWFSCLFLGFFFCLPSWENSWFLALNCVSLVTLFLVSWLLA